MKTNNTINPFLLKINGLKSFRPIRFGTSKNWNDNFQLQANKIMNSKELETLIAIMELDDDYQKFIHKSLKNMKYQEMNEQYSNYYQVFQKALNIIHSLNIEMDNNRSYNTVKLSRIEMPGGLNTPYTKQEQYQISKDKKEVEKNERYEYLLWLFKKKNIPSSIIPEFNKVSMSQMNNVIMKVQTMNKMVMEQ